MGQNFRSRRGNIKKFGSIEIPLFLRFFFFLIPCAGNWLTDHNERPNSYYTMIRRFLFELVDIISLDRNYEEVINLLFVLPFYVIFEYT